MNINVIKFYSCSVVYAIICLAVPFILLSNKSIDHGSISLLTGFFYHLMYCAVSFWILFALYYLKLRMRYPKGILETVMRKKPIEFIQQYKLEFIVMFISSSVYAYGYSTDTYILKVLGIGVYVFYFSFVIFDKVVKDYKRISKVAYSNALMNALYKTNDEKLSIK